MSTVSQPTDFELFIQFAQEQLANGAREMSPEDSLQLWRARRAEQIEKLNQRLEKAAEQSERGESFELDVEAMIARVAEHLTEKGITD